MTPTKSERFGTHLFYFNFGKNFAFGPISMITQAIILVGVWKLPFFMVLVIFVVGIIIIYIIGYVLDKFGIRTGFKNAEFRETDLIKK